MDPQQIRILTIIAVASDDELFHRLVLKGGNAIAVGHQINARVSTDIDYSMSNAFDSDQLEAIRVRIENRLKQTFTPHGIIPFDIQLTEKPPDISPENQDFWGGYLIIFKVTTLETYQANKNDLEFLRKTSIPVSPDDRRKFEIEISKYEYCEYIQKITIDGYQTQVYPPIVIVCEKLRAICQQMPEYQSIVKRHASRQTARPKDFFDVHLLIEHFKLDLTTTNFRELLKSVFAAKKVPLSLLNKVSDTYEQHYSGWPSLKDTVIDQTSLRDFRFYFDYVLQQIQKLHPFREK